MQSEQHYSDNYIKLYDLILELINIIENSFQEKNESYINLLYFIYFTNCRYNSEIKLELLTNFFKNKHLLIKSKFFLNIFLSELSPKFPRKREKKTLEEICFEYTDNFLNLNIKKLIRYENLIKIIENINIQEFNRILLDFFEEKCQSYFISILKDNKDDYSEKCCKD